MLFVSQYVAQKGANMLSLLKYNTDIMKPNLNTEDGLFDWVWQPLRLPGMETTKITHAKTLSESYRVVESEDRLTASFDIPGVKPESVEVSTDNDVITISYDLRGEKITRTYRVPSQYDVDTIKCTIELGVLEMIFTRAPPRTGKKVEITVK